MRAMMGLIKDRHGTTTPRRRVPERLQEAVARVLNTDKSKQVFLKKSLGTKVLKAANVAATHVLADFDRTLASAEALLKERPVVSLVTEAQINEWLRATMPQSCKAMKKGGRKAQGQSQSFKALLNSSLRRAWTSVRRSRSVKRRKRVCLTARVFKREHALSESLPDANSALAKGDITHVRLDIDELLEAFQLNLDR